MNEAKVGTGINAWIAIDRSEGNRDFPYPEYFVELNGERQRFSAIAEGDWIIVVTPEDHFIRTGRVLRLRGGLDYTTLYFDRMLAAGESVGIEVADLATPQSGSVARLGWKDFAKALPKLIGKTVDHVPLIDDQAYIRELLQISVIDDLLGPANGPHEQIVDMGVRDRYLVGKLAPMESDGGGIEGLEGPLAAEAEDTDLGDLDVHKRVGTSRARSSKARLAGSMLKLRRSTRSTRRATSRSSLRVSG